MFLLSWALALAYTFHVVNGDLAVKVTPVTELKTEGTSLFRKMATAFREIPTIRSNERTGKGLNFWRAAKRFLCPCTLPSLTNNTHKEENGKFESFVSSSELPEVDQTGVSEVTRMSVVDAHQQVERVAGQDWAQELKKKYFLMKSLSKCWQEHKECKKVRWAALFGACFC